MKKLTVEQRDVILREAYIKAKARNVSEYVYMDDLERVLNENTEEEKICIGCEFEMSRENFLVEGGFRDGYLCNNCGEVYPACGECGDAMYKTRITPVYDKEGKLHGGGIKWNCPNCGKAE